MNSASIHRNASTRAVVTGGTQGVGFAIAKRLAQEGAPSLVVAGRDVTKGERAAAELRELGSECVFVKTDVAVPGDCGRLMERAFAVGNVNALVNAAESPRAAHCLIPDLRSGVPISTRILAGPSS